MELVEAEPEQPLDCPTQPALGQEDLCDCNPEFAVICSFIQQFGERIDLQLDIEKLKSGLENQENLDDDLIEIHVKLLKKLRRYFVRDQWEKALMRYAFEYSYEHGREIELQGYLKTRPSVKLQLLRRLLDAQFECDQKFKAIVNADEANELRNQPLGRDIEGNIYWHCQDKEGHLRVYNEQPLDHRSWKLLSNDITKLDQLIEDLDQAKDDKIRGEPQAEPYNPYPEIFPEFFIKEDLDLEDNETEETEPSSKKSTKKGRRGRSMKKSSSPATVPASVKQVTPNGPKISQTEVKVHHHPVKLEPLASQDSSQATSIESQVKLTLDNILQKVSNSLDFFFRWNSTHNEKKDVALAPKPRKRNTKRERVLPEELPRRTSSRIQQMQQRKITEYVERKAEPIASNDVKVPKFAQEDIKSNNTHSRSKKSLKKDKQRWRTKGKKKLSWDKDDSDLSSTSSLTESNDESFVEELNGALDPDTIHESDEFACEEEETNDAPVIIKRARTARQVVRSQEDGIPSQDQSVVEEDKPCGRCDKSNDPECILLCDMCDDGYHTVCCIPPLMFVPDGDWFCPPCEHKTLLTKLREISSAIKEILAEKERERQKRQRLRHAFKKTAVSHTKDEILPEKRNKTQLPDLNHPIAAQELDEILGESSGQELPNSYRERAHKTSRKTKARQPRSRRGAREVSEDEYEENYGRAYSRRKQLVSSEDESQSSSSSDDESQPRTRKARACVSYRFQEFDELIQSAIQADSDDQMPVDDDAAEEKISNYGRGKDMATIEAIAYQQENGIKDQGLTIASTPIVSTEPTNSSRTRKKGRRLNDLDAESEIDLATSDDSFQAASETDIEEEEEEEITEVDSEDESSIDEIIHVRKPGSRHRGQKKKSRNRYESDESDYEPRTRRRASQKVSYKESSDEEDEDILDPPHRERRGVLSSDEDSDASWKSSAASQADQAQEEDDAPTDIDERPSPKIENTATASPNNGAEIEINNKQVPEIDSANTETLASVEEPGPKRIRLEKRETRPVFTSNSLDESIDEIAAPLYRPKTSAKIQRKSKSKPVSPSKISPILKPQPDTSKHKILVPPQSVSSPQTVPRLPAILPQSPMNVPPLHYPNQHPHPQSHPHPHPHPHPSPDVLPHHQPPQYPTYPQPIYPQHHQYPGPQYYPPPMYPQPPPHFSQHPIPYMMRPPPGPSPLPQTSMNTNPMDDLNQYCNRSPYPGSIFSSFNVSHPPKNPPPHPPFYREDEVRPPSNSTNNNEQKSW